MEKQKSDIASGTVAALKALTRRIDNRLGEVQAKVRRCAPLQVRLDKRKSRLPFVFKLVPLLSTLMLAWVLYTQAVVIQHHWTRVRRPVA